MAGPPETSSAHRPWLLQRGAWAAAAVCVTTIAAALPFGAPASGGVGVPGRVAGEPAVGVNVHATWSDMDASTLAAGYKKLAAAGVRWVRIDMGWKSFESKGPGQVAKWYVRKSDLAVNQARAHGLHVLAMLWSTPKWANGNKTRNVGPSDPAQYARFAGWAAKHFAGRVEAWEMWNEPNLNGFWAGKNPARYAALARAAYPAIKEADPAATVVLAGIAYNDTDYLKALYNDGIRGSFDVLATHPYPGLADQPPEAPDDGTEYTLAHVQAVHQLMVDHGDATKPIWFTEFGWSTHRNTTSTPGVRRGVSDKTQGDYLVRTLRWIAVNARYVTNVFWYTERDETSGNIHVDNYGLLTYDLMPKASYRTLSTHLHSSVS